MTGVGIEHLSKRFGSAVALNDINLDIAPGELFFLLGPSGCGKSTLLRLIAGLERPSVGRIRFNGRDVTRLDTRKRNAVMCFQSYALWPHMTVEQNVRFGPAVRRLAAKERDGRVAEALKLVRMDGLAQRKPGQLSGGQQQRVALARAIAVRPDCLLLDEPLSNLDAKLRLEMRGEIRRICKSGGLTAVYVTHDQKEALSIADRIAVMSEGRLAQVGTPAELYLKPRNSFVAGFIAPTNLLRGRVTESAGSWVEVETVAGPIRVAGAGPAIGSQVLLSIRPQQFRVVDWGPVGERNRFAARVLESTFLGESSEHVVMVGTERLNVTCTPPLLAPPTELILECSPGDVVILEE